MLVSVRIRFQPGPGALMVESGMVHITLYVPDSEPLEFAAETYGLHEGVLTFRAETDGAQPTDIKTTVPFVIRQIVEDKAQTTRARGPRSTSVTGY